MTKELDILSIETKTGLELVEHYKEVLPEKLIKLEALRRLDKARKDLEKEIKVMVNEIGEYSCEFYDINEKTTITNTVDYHELNDIIKDIESSGKFQEQVKELKDKINESIEIKKPAEKLKLLEDIDKDLADKARIRTEKTELVLKPNSENLLDLIDSELKKPLDILTKVVN